MATDKQFVQFHEFWTWQYTKRNCAYANTARHINCEGLRLVKDKLLKRAGDIIVTDYAPKEMLLRTPSVQETKVLRAAELVHKRLIDETGYCLGEILTKKPNSESIVKGINDPQFLEKSLPDNLKYEVRDNGVKWSTIISRENADQWGKVDQWRHFSEYVGLGLLFVDLELPRDVVVSQLMASIEVLRQIKNKISLISDASLTKYCVETIHTELRSIRIASGDKPRKVLAGLKSLGKHLSGMCGENVRFYWTSELGSDEKEQQIVCACGTCSMSGTCEYGLPSVFTTAKQFIQRSIPGASFNPDRPAPRAIGLWLWDYVQEHGGEKRRGVIASAIRAIKEQLGPELKTLGFAASEERVFRGLHRRTAECIEACEVLSFK